MSKWPEGWIIATLKEVCGRIVDGSHNPPKAVEHGFPMLSARNIQNRRIILDDFRYISPNDFSVEDARTRIQAGDVLLTIVGAIGRAAVVKKEDPRFVLQRSVAVLQSTGVDSRYLSYVLESPYIQEYLNENAKGTAQKGIYLGSLSKLRIPVAPFEEQKRIADKLDLLLSWIDACRERLYRVPRILKRFRQAVLSAATSGQLTEGWRIDAGVSLGSWQTRSGSNIFSFITSGSRGWASFYADSGAIFLRVGNLDHHTTELDLRDLQYVRPPDGAEGRRTRIEVGDIIISITADIGMVAFIREDLGETYINQHLCLARQTGDHVGEYLAYYLASPSGGLAQLIEAQRGATKAGLTLGDIRALSFKLPPLDEQKEIVRRVAILFAFANHLEARVNAARIEVDRLTPALLAKAFRGELVPQDPNDEPASALLERMRLLRITQVSKRKKDSILRTPKMTTLTRESVKEAIGHFAEDMFSFEELRSRVPGDYNVLKEIVFSFLEDSDPVLLQVFDQQAKAMRFLRRRK